MMYVVAAHPRAQRPNGLCLYRAKRCLHYHSEPSVPSCRLVVTIGRDAGAKGPVLRDRLAPKIAATRLTSARAIDKGRGHAVMKGPGPDSRAHYTRTGIGPSRIRCGSGSGLRGCKDRVERVRDPRAIEASAAVPVGRCERRRARTFLFRPRPSARNPRERIPRLGLDRTAGLVQASLAQ